MGRMSCNVLTITAVVLSIFGIYFFMIHNQILFCGSYTKVDPYSDAVKIPEISVLRGMVHEQLASLYHGYVNSLQIFCRKIDRLGKLEDGGWDICGDYKYRPRNDCLVYSFGINNDFSFDDAISKKYNCEVHSFDPSMGVADYKRSAKVLFHNFGLSNNNNTKPVKSKKWKMRTLAAIKEELRHLQRPLSVLKIDIEEDEWKVVPEMIESGVLRNVRQFVLEFHIIDISTKEEPTHDKYRKGLIALKGLYQIGFRIFWMHKNLFCKFLSKSGQSRCGCHEISFIRVE